MPEGSCLWNLAEDRVRDAIVISRISGGRMSGKSRSAIAEVDPTFQLSRGYCNR